jgi:hypothetical protein
MTRGFRIFVILAAGFVAYAAIPWLLAVYEMSWRGRFITLLYFSPIAAVLAWMIVANNRAYRRQKEAERIAEAYLRSEKSYLAGHRN